MTALNPTWSRRTWLARNTATLAALTTTQGIVPRGGATAREGARAARLAQQAIRLDPGPFEAVAQQAVDAARAAGAVYADARLTRKVGHLYGLGGGSQLFWNDTELVGVGVRALVDGAWGFAACPWRTTDEVVGLARDAVAQAKVNAKGSPQRVELGQLPAAVGRWTTPLQTDPFAVSVEEKLDTCQYWQVLLHRHQMSDGGIIFQLGALTFIRQERVVATSDGSCFTQTTYETGGYLQSGIQNKPDLGSTMFRGLVPSGQGWEQIVNAHIPEQIETAADTLQARAASGSKPTTVGRYTVVCDGATMASLVAQTVGVATQLDRALGYEANAGGTSFLDDPLGMVGHLQIASPLVTVTANRSVPTQLATVQWDDEGVMPVPFTLIREGIVVDFQTTREQAAWLAPYYVPRGIPVRSHGCAASEDALMAPLQMMPNLALEPGHAAVGVDDLVATVRDGILLEGGSASDVDFQARNGLLYGQMREIKNGRLGRNLTGGALMFNSIDLWRHVQAVAGPSTVQTIAGASVGDNFFHGGHGPGKGEPSQVTSFSAQGVAALIPNLPLIDPSRKI